MPTTPPTPASAMPAAALPAAALPATVLPTAWRIPDRVAYVVSHSPPYSSNGYATRTHAVARALVAAGHDVIVFNRPGRPWDIEGFDPGADVAPDQTLDGVRYVFLPMLPVAGVKAGAARLKQAEDVLAEAFAVFRPAAVLSACNWENAEPAQRAAARSGAVFFHEQRGFWEMSDNAAEPGQPLGQEELKVRLRETQVAQAARAVFTLNEPMRGELILRGVPEDSIHLVPNGVGLPGPVDPKLTRRKIGCTSDHLLGYIGSLSRYEGVEDLLHLTARLRGEGVDVAALIVGSSAPKGLIGSDHAQTEEDLLRALAERLGIAAVVHLIPQVPEAQIGAYYTMCDAIILPRRRTRVTALVPPVKPYAAAAYSVPVFMTDLPPLAEIAAEIGASLFAEGDLEGLAAGVKQALHNGHPASVMTLPPGVFWSERIRPLSDQLRQVARAERARLAEVLPAALAPTRASAASSVAAGGRFDTRALPFVELYPQLRTAPVACVGPGLTLAGGGPVMHLTRQNILETLATAEPGRFVIDWAGLQADPGEWQGLWSIDTMRLNRQIMDACRIALDRGWQLQVLGPVHRSQAPLFRTVAGVLDEILPDAPPPETPIPAAGNIPEVAP